MTSARLLIVTGLMIAAALVVAGCTRGGDDSTSTDDGLSVEIAIIPDPPEVGPARVEITIHDANGEPVNDADLMVEGNMSHAGMEPVTVHIAGGVAGRYTTSDFEFTMGGDWIVTITGTLSDGREFERTFDLDGVDS